MVQGKSDINIGGLMSNKGGKPFTLTAAMRAHMVSFFKGTDFWSFLPFQSYFL